MGSCSIKERSAITPGPQPIHKAYVQALTGLHLSLCKGTPDSKARQLPSVVVGGGVTEVVGVGAGVDVLTEVGPDEVVTVTGVVLTVLPVVLLESVVPEVVVGADPVVVGGALLLDTLVLDTLVLVVLCEVGPGKTQGFIVASRPIAFPLSVLISQLTSPCSTTTSPGSSECRNGDSLISPICVIAEFYS